MFLFLFLFVGEKIVAGWQTTCSEAAQSGSSRYNNLNMRQCNYYPTCSVMTHCGTPQLYPYNPGKFMSIAGGADRRRREIFPSNEKNITRDKRAVMKAAMPMMPMMPMMAATGPIMAQNMACYSGSDYWTRPPTKLRDRATCEPGYNLVPPNLCQYQCDAKNMHLCQDGRVDYYINTFAPNTMPENDNFEGVVLSNMAMSPSKKIKETFVTRPDNGNMQNVNDKNPTTCIKHGVNGDTLARPWFRASLPGKTLVKRIRIWAGTDVIHMDNIQVRVDDAICGSFRNPSPPPNGYMDVVCNGGTGLIGSTITIQKDTFGVLEVCEIKVDGKPTTHGNRKTIQVTPITKTINNIDGSLAVDLKGPETCMQIENKDNKLMSPWWSADLGSPQNIYSIRISGLGGSPKHKRFFPELISCIEWYGWSAFWDELEGIQATVDGVVCGHNYNHGPECISENRCLKDSYIELVCPKGTVGQTIKITRPFGSLTICDVQFIQNPKKSNVTGVVQVISEDGNKPVPAINVSLIDSNGKIIDTQPTDNNGKYNLKTYPGTFTLVAIPNIDMVSDEPITLTIKQDENINKDIKLKYKPAGPISGFVTRLDTNAPVPGVNVVLTDSKNQVRKILTGDDGSYKFLTAVAGDVTISINGYPSGLRTTKDTPLGKNIITLRRGFPAFQDFFLEVGTELQPDEINSQNNCPVDTQTVNKASLKNDKNKQETNLLKPNSNQKKPPKDSEDCFGCDSNASCVDAVCVCNTGFVGDGSTCVSNDNIV